ncbi:MAG: hypothetical protein K2O43_07000 [Muribaculaceae bacterium]|nr:hypothetical protein [Muribaculaceae bacterium]
MVNRLKKILTVYLPMLIMAAVAWSCNDKEEPNNEFTYYNVVIYDGAVDGQPVFLTVNPETGDDVIYTSGATVTLNNINPGDCAFIGYTIPDNRTAYSSGKIYLIGYSEMTNIKSQIIEHKDIEGWDSTPIYMMSYYTMYNRLILQAQIPYSTTKRKLGLVVDKSTLGDEMATAYLYQQLEDGEPTFEREYRIAFDLSNIVEQLPGNSLKVMINNSNLPMDSFIIKLDK